MNMPDRQAAIDARVLAYYGDEFDESRRLTTRSPQGPLELRRTLEVVGSHFPGGRVVDIGGGTGRYARALLDAGSSVELVDPVPRHVEEAKRSGVSARLGDARALPFIDDEFDAALLLGPLYHLAERADRLLALREAARVTREGGLVIASAISRFVSFGALFLGSLSSASLTPDLISLLTEGAAPPTLRFPAGHFHTSEELQLELELAGLTVREVVGVEGPAGVLLERVSDASTQTVDAALTIAREAGSLPAIRDFSAHLLAVGVVQEHGA